jgi:hypothetical protein
LLNLNRPIWFKERVAREPAFGSTAQLLKRARVKRVCSGKPLLIGTQTLRTLTRNSTIDLQLSAPVQKWFSRSFRAGQGVPNDKT